MLSYTHDQAIALLSQKLDTAKRSLGNAVEDLEYLTEQVMLFHFGGPSDRLATEQRHLRCLNRLR